MTKHQQTQDAISIMQAWLAGKPIETKGAHSATDQWTLLDKIDPSWNFSYNSYRVAPEPMEIEVWVNKDGVMARDGAPWFTVRWLKPVSPSESSGRSYEYSNDRTH